MNIHTVDTDRLDHPGAVEYFTRNAHRLAACRALLELLSIPFPGWARRDISGRAAANRDAIAAFRADNPQTLYQETMRKVAQHTSRLPAKDEKAGHIDTSFLG